MNFLYVMKGSATYRKSLASGCTIYRKSGEPYVYLVPDGLSHSDAWAALKGSAVK